MERPVDERLGVRLDRRERRLELVRRIGDEVLSHALEPPEFSHIVEYEDRTRWRGTGQGGAVDRQNACLNPQRLTACQREFTLVRSGSRERGLDRVLDLRAAD